MSLDPQIPQGPELQVGEPTQTPDAQDQGVTVNIPTEEAKAILGPLQALVKQIEAAVQPPEEDMGSLAGLTDELKQQSDMERPRS